MERTTKIFEGMMRRMLGPATSLFVSLFIFHEIETRITGNTDGCWFFGCFYIFLSLSIPTAIIFTIIALIGIDYVLATSYSLVIEAGLQDSFDSGDLELTSLRTKVIEKLKTTTRFCYFDKPFFNSDYFLYEILDCMNPTSARSFTNKAKTYGIVALAAGVALLSILICQWDLFIIYILGFFLLRFLGIKMANTEYRRRTVRLYVNFLLASKEQSEAAPTDFEQTDPNETNIPV